MRYDIEADWVLLNTCNYRCAYCFVPEQQLGEKLRVFASPARWQRAFDATDLTWQLHLTGGEPCIYPEFAEFCERLSRRHYLSLNSNLTHPSIREFAHRVDPTRVSFINAGLHYTERGDRDGFPNFIRHAELLHTRGFSIFISVVATPEVLGQVDAVIERLRSTGLTPLPKILNGIYEGRVYPNAYTDPERRQFRDFSARAQAANRELLARMPERPSIDLAADEAVLDAIPSFRGKMCAAGQSFVRIQPNGDVFRCSTRTALGNVLNGTLSLRATPAPCNTGHCFYFCRKYTARAASGSSPAHRVGWAERGVQWIAALR